MTTAVHLPGEITSDSHHGPPQGLGIEAPVELCSPGGTSTTTRGFRDRLPIFLAPPPKGNGHEQRRDSYRICVTLKSLVEWREPEPPHTLTRRQGILTNLSGSGAQIFLRQLPAEETLRLSISLPEAFIEEQARRQLSRFKLPARHLFLSSTSFLQARERICRSFRSIEATIAHAKTHVRDADPIYVLSVAFLEPHETCYRLVRYLERQALQQEVCEANRPVWPA